MLINKLIKSNFFNQPKTCKLCITNKNFIKKKNFLKNPKKNKNQKKIKRESNPLSFTIGRNIFPVNILAVKCRLLISTSYTM